MFTGRNSRGKKLLKVQLEFHPMETCNDSLTRQADPSELRKVMSVGLLDDSMLCVGVLEGGKDPCQVRSRHRVLLERSPIFTETEARSVGTEVHLRYWLTDQQYCCAFPRIRPNFLFWRPEIMIYISQVSA